MVITPTFVSDEISETEYHSWPQLSNSKLNDMQLSPRNFWMKHLNPDRLIEEPTASMAEGTICHMALLEPAKFAARYQMTTLDRKGTKAWEAESAEAALLGKELLKEKDWQRYSHMMSVLNDNDLVQNCVRKARAEVSVRWKEKGIIKSHVEFKARLDILQDWGIIDVKTSRDPENFEKSCVTYGYHRQAAMYRRAAHAATGKFLPFSFLVFSTSYPYTVRVFMASDDFLNAGRAELDQLILQYESCSDSGKWPDACGPFQLNLPKWYGGNNE